MFTFSEANSSNPVVFVAREADDGVVAWGIPLTPEEWVVVWCTSMLCASCSIVCVCM